MDGGMTGEELFNLEREVRDVIVFGEKRVWPEYAWRNVHEQTRQIYNELARRISDIHA